MQHAKNTLDPPIALMIINEKKVDCHYQIDNFFKKGTFSLRNEVLAEKSWVEPQVGKILYESYKHTILGSSYRNERNYNKNFHPFFLIRLQWIFVKKPHIKNIKVGVLILLSK